MARRSFRIARISSRARVRPDLRISEADPAPPSLQAVRSADSLLTQVKARQQRLYGARWASTTPPPARDEQAQAQGDTEGASVASHSSSSMSNPRLMTLAKPAFAVRALNNLSYGATSQSIAEFNALGSNDFQRLANWVDWQLDWTSINDSALDARLASAGYTTLGKSLTQLWADHIKADPEYNVRMRPAWEVQRAAYVRATHSKRQLREVIVNFWHAHFNVMGSDFSAGPVFVHYDRDVIRANATGNFRAMLEAVASSTSMLYYLDNLNNSRAGPNENFARELLELHTLGVDNYLGFMDPFLVPKCPEDPAYPIGYTDIDVYETSAAFTGWSAKNGHWQFPTENDGTFVYRQSWHDAGPKFLLGMMIYPEQPELKDGRDVLDRLASHPRVAKFICKKLIRRFINDTPSQKLIDSAAAIFRANWQHPKQIEITLRHILNSDDLYNSWGQKIRRPFEATVAAMRVLGQTWTVRLDHDKSNEFMWRVGYTGQTAYNWPSPNGYPDIAVSWSGANSFAMTWKLINWMTETKEAEVPMSPILDATRTGVASWTANNLVNFWCQRLLGYQPTAERKSVLSRFMAQNGNAATDVIADTDAWAASDLKKHYNQQRLRSMVSLILLSPEFQTR
ncbi:MAG: DUF1800 domain-containing protein [Pseudoxanthomonas sp.]